MKATESKQNLIEESVSISSTVNAVSERPLTGVEKTFLLHAERGDCATVRRIIQEYADKPEEFDLNCVDPLNRSALISAIENENIELIKLLLESKIKVKDALLHAIKEEYVEAVEVLLTWEEETHEEGQPYSWERVDYASATFTPDVTPLIMAAHRNNYEIIKLLLDRGATLPMPHDVRGRSQYYNNNDRPHTELFEESPHYDGLNYYNMSSAEIKQSETPRIFKSNLEELLTSSASYTLEVFEDCLKSQSSNVRTLNLVKIRGWIGTKKILLRYSAQSMFTCLNEPKSFKLFENMEMRKQVETFSTNLLDHARTSYELEIILNYNHKSPEWVTGERQTLERLKLAIKYKQKNFVSHPNVQQLLAAIWYDGLPGFRRKNLIGQAVWVGRLASMFPVYCTIYMIAPNSTMGQFLKKPFIKFICHSASYALFLMLLGSASQRIEILVLEWFGTDWVQDMVLEWKRKERGALPGLAECGVILFVISLIWAEIKSLWTEGLMEYMSDLWNIVDFITNIFYVAWLATRMTAWFITWRDERQGKDPYYPREKWDSFEPMLISEGAFAAGMIFSFLKLVHIFSVNPHLGPLQISLGRMIIDIVKFFFIYSLVLFAFGCGLNQLLWYYAELEKNICYHLPSGLPDFDNHDKACTIWRRFANLFETSQSLFWASFGLVDLMVFELNGIKSFTRFWALLMFGSYSVINIIVLLNMLIAMMSNSYQLISERADSEWKFARSRLWISYFDDGDTLPPPFNIFPTSKLFIKSLKCGKDAEGDNEEVSKKRIQETHESVVKLVIKRYVTAEQRKRDESGITEDDVMEIRQDISSLKYDLIDILRQNGMRVPDTISNQDKQVSGKKGKIIERQILKDFHIGLVEDIASQETIRRDDLLGFVAKAFVRKLTMKSKKKDWNSLVKRNSVSNPIGSSMNNPNSKWKSENFRKNLLSNLHRLRENKPCISEDGYNLMEVVPPSATRISFEKETDGNTTQTSENSSTGPTSQLTAGGGGVASKWRLVQKLGNSKASAESPDCKETKSEVRTSNMKQPEDIETAKDAKHASVQEEVLENTKNDIAPAKDSDLKSEKSDITTEKSDEVESAKIDDISTPADSVKSGEVTKKSEDSNSEKEKISPPQAGRANSENIERAATREIAAPRVPIRKTCYGKDWL